MRTILSWLIGIPAGAIVVLFALSNRADVTVGLWPFADGVQLPLYVAALLPLAAGLLLGLFMAGVATLRARTQAGSLRRRVKALETELDTLRARTSVPTSSLAPTDTPEGPILPT